jgi:two-component system, NtrC family, sensor histidine kinase HydH
MKDRKPIALRWIDLLWLAFLGGLACISPVREIHKQLILLAIGGFQLIEGWLVARLPERGRAYSVIIKILLATILLDHTGAMGINSSYYPIYYLPVVTAAVYFGPMGTILWTALASLAYCSYLIPALQEYELTANGATELAIRILFFFLAAVLVNRFAIENRRQVQRYQVLSEELAVTNRELRRVQEDARRSERLAALGQLSAGLAHEIRNPLGVIKGSAEMLGRELQGSQTLAVELAGYISEQVNRLNALVARFLDFARPLHLTLQTLDLPAVMDRAVDSVRNQYPQSRVTIERDYAPDVPSIRGDEQMCEQVFVNLIANAFEAMEGSRVAKLHIAILAASADNRSGATIDVEDSGPGVPPDLRQQIFNPFYTSKKSGVGLGLSIVAKIVDDHGGSIQVTDAADGGARFHIFLPTTAGSG